LVARPPTPLDGLCRWRETHDPSWPAALAGAQLSFLVARLSLIDCVSRPPWFLRGSFVVPSWFLRGSFVVPSSLQSAGRFSLAGPVLAPSYCGGPLAVFWALSHMSLPNPPVSICCVDSLALVRLSRICLFETARKLPHSRAPRAQRCPYVSAHWYTLSAQLLRRPQGVVGRAAAQPRRMDPLSAPTARVSSEEDRMDPRLRQYLRCENVLPDRDG